MSMEQGIDFRTLSLINHFLEEKQLQAVQSFSLSKLMQLSIDLLFEGKEYNDVFGSLWRGEVRGKLKTFLP